MNNIHVLYSEPLEYLIDKFQNLEVKEPSRNIETICILPGLIVMNNLRRRLSLSTQDFSNKIELSTIEMIASRIVSTGVDGDINTISDSVRKELIADILKDLITEKKEFFEKNKLLINAIDLEDNDILSVFDQELDEYFRSCDSGKEKVLLDNLAENIESPFWKQKAENVLDLFDFIHIKLLNEMKVAGENSFLSRSHLVTKAYEILLNDNILWRENYPNLKEINVIGITVLDSPTLHFLSILNQKCEDIKLNIFTGVGTKDHILQRLKNAKIEFVIENLEKEKVEVKSSERAFRDFFFRKGEWVDNQLDDGNIKYVSAPSPKKEIEEISIIIRRYLFLNKIRPKDIILVAKSIGKYKTYIENIFETASIPYSIETRNPMAYSAVYRFLKATIDLLVKIEEGSYIRYTDIMDPLRLGFCLPKQKTLTTYPVIDRIFLSLEENLDFIEQRHYSFNPSDKGLTLDTWRKEIEGLFPWMKNIINEYLDWLVSNLNLSDKTASSYTTILKSLIYHYTKRIRKVFFHSISGPGIENSRFQFFKYHPTSEANRIKKRIPEINTVLEYLDKKNADESILWRDIAKAFGELVGGETFGLFNQDQNAILCIDAANTLFREAKYMFVIGLQSEEFPRKCPDSIFFPLEIKKEFEKLKYVLSQEDNRYAYLYNLSPENDYASELDFFESVLMSTNRVLHLSRTYLDREGRRREWSSFLDNIENIEEQERRIFPSEIFSFLSDKVDDVEDLSLLSDKEILKLYNWIVHRGNNNLFPKISKDFFNQIYSVTNLKIQDEEIKDRITRYLNPPSMIEVKENSTYLNGIILKSILGSPYRFHELTLAYECPFRFYFYQFYFNWYKGDNISRDIPNYSTKRIHFRYGFYPKILRKLFLRKSEEEKLYEIYMSKIIEREEIVRIDPTTLISQHFDTKTSFFIEKYDPIITAEKKIFNNENTNNLKRKWEVLDEQSIEFEDEICIILPKHRLDSITITKESGKKETFLLPVFHNNTSYSLMGGFQGPKFEDLDENSIYDLRIPFIHNYYQDRKNKSFFGVEFLEPFTGKRRGIFKQYVGTKYNYYTINSLYPKEINEKSVLIRYGGFRDPFNIKMRNTVEHTLNIMKMVRNGIFNSSERANRECKNCDYLRLCRGYSTKQTSMEDD